MVRTKEKVMTIISSKILRVFATEGLYFYEIEVVYDNGEIKRGLRVPFTDIKGHRKIERFPSKNKVRDWLNTDEGREYLAKVFPKDD